MRKIRIDFDNPGLPQHISAVENDSQSRFFQATLYENGKAYAAPEGATYSIMYRGFGPQNQGWYDTINDGAGKRAACVVSGNVVTCEIARQALQVPGHVSIVLCVTTGKGYMLKSWPIECDCKNDRYDSTVEIQSFFYVTQISNESWTQAIQAAEELKNTIDPTLSLSGKAADAKATGDAVGELKSDIIKLENPLFDFIKAEPTTEIRGKFTSGEIGKVITENENTDYRFLKIDVSKARKVQVTYFSNGFLYNAIFTGTNDIIIKKELYREFSDTTEQKIDVELNVPVNSKYLYLNSSVYGELYAKSYEYRKSNWFGKKCVCLGDSITEQGTWLPYLKNELGFSEVVNRGIGGSTIGYTYTNAFWQDKRVNSIDLDADCVLIMGGTNDAGSGVPLSSIISKDIHNKESVVGAYNILLSKIFYKFYKLSSGFYSDVDYSGVTQVEHPRDITVMLISPTFTNSPLYIGSDAENRLVPIVNAVPKIADFWNVPYCENYYKSGINDQNFSMYLKKENYEGNTIFVHPNDKGGEKIGARIVNCLRLYAPVN